MPRVPILKAKDFFRLLIKYGCIAVSIKGSHHKILNPKTSKTSIVAIHAGKDIDRGAFTSVLSQLGIGLNDFLNFIVNN